MQYLLNKGKLLILYLAYKHNNPLDFPVSFVVCYLIYLKIFFAAEKRSKGSTLVVPSQLTQKYFA